MNNAAGRQGSQERERNSESAPIRSVGKGEMGTVLFLTLLGVWLGQVGDSGLIVRTRAQVSDWPLEHPVLLSKLWEERAVDRSASTGC